jgi:putative copper export protein
MDATVKASLYVGTVLLIGAGVYRSFINVFESPPPLRWLLLTGFILVVTSSLANLTLTVMNVLGRFDPAFTWQYATNTRHGTMTFIRLGLASLLLVLMVLTRWKTVQGILVGLASLGFLYTLSSISHPASMGRLPLLADFLHITAASLWAGAVIYSAVLPVWSKADFSTMIRRVSSLGLTSVVLLVATGIYIIVVHLQFTTTALLSTTYERILLAKLLIVVVILMLSAINRWYFIPRLETTARGFRRTLLVEATLLLTVLVTTGVLTVTPLPHE